MTARRPRPAPAPSTAHAASSASDAAFADRPTARPTAREATSPREREAGAAAAAAAPLDVLVIGAGQAGLAAGYHLRRAGLRFEIVDAADAPGGGWPGHYDSLRLFSPARHSALPGLPFPGDPGRYPTRDETVAYLRGYAEHFRLPLRLRTRIERVQRRADGFVAHADTGLAIAARRLLVATGPFREPQRPSLPGEAGFRGRVLHASDYRGPRPFAGQRVIVVGAANSAVQIAAELAEVADVTLAARRPPNFIRQRVLGLDVHDWWALLRLDRGPVQGLRGRLFRRWMAGDGPPVLDDGRYRAALAAGRPRLQPMFERFTTSGVAWSDGREVPADAVIFATGYAPGLGLLDGLGALSPAGQPLQRGGISTTVPGLGFVGWSYQRSFASATLRGVGYDAAAIVAQWREPAAGTATAGRVQPAA